MSTTAIAPREGDTNTEYVFTLRYIGEVTPEAVEVIIEDQVVQMSEIDTTDLNFTDGKDYFHKTKLPKGVSIYYFKVMVDGQKGWLPEAFVKR